MGSSGQVRKARHKPTGKIVAIKEIKATTRHLPEIEKEMQTLYRDQKHNCPYVIDFFGAYLEVCLYLYLVFSPL